MKNVFLFDVLIVYNQRMARSASGLSPARLTPFSRLSANSSYNQVYGYFLEVCQKNNLKAAFTTSGEITGPGTCNSFWIFKQKKWHKVNHPCFSPLIFDKFSPTTKSFARRRQLLFSNSQTKPFNDPELFNLFFDKQKTFDKLSEHSIPTISLGDQSLQSLKSALKELSSTMDRHPGSADFTTDIIMKDRFGAGGRNVYKFSPNEWDKMISVINQNTKVSYIIQPFAKFDKGFTYHHRPASTDIRLVYLKGKIIQSYIRVAKSGEFRCNEHQGGLLTYVSLGDLPPLVVAKSNIIADSLNNSCSLFALDFIMSNNGNPYLLEGNTGPGLDWNTSLKKNEYQAKKLIRLVVGELATRTRANIAVV